MLKVRLDVAALLAIGALVAAGCSTTAVPSGSSVAATPPGTILPSGADGRFAGRTAVPQLFPLLPLSKPIPIERELFVSNQANAVVVLANKTYKKIGKIIKGIGGSDGVWVDQHGSVYVANFTAVDVTEYKLGGHGKPACTYSLDLHDPINVTTDKAGNVYVVDFNFHKLHGYIYEYAQCTNTVLAKYTVTSGPEGIAVDRRGDIFVSYYKGNIGAFEEFMPGTPVPKQFAAIVDSPGGIVFDRAGNLIADDQAGTIDIIPPPYISPTTLIAGLSDPFHDAFNKTQTLLFSANSGSATVTVYSYPSATLLTTLGSSNGITAADGVADSQ